MSGCLEGLRVVDTAGVPAALAGRLLAELGAEVVKIEPPGGDPSRRDDLFFAYYNAGKRSLVLDASRASDRARLEEILATADVWIDTTHPSDAQAWGLAFDAVLAANPRLVLARVTPFGLTGPFAGYRANDLVAQAAGGFVFVNGHPGEPPLQGYGLQAYHSASNYAVIGVLLALLERERNGRGQTVDVSLQEATAGALEEASAAWNSERRIEVRRGTLHWTRIFRVGRARDGLVLYCLLGDWTTLHGWMLERGHGAEFAGEEWGEYPYRRDHSEPLFDALDRWAADQSAEEILEGAQLRRLPFGSVRPPEAMLEDPQLKDRGFFAKIEGGLIFPAPPFRMSRTPLKTTRGAPGPGEMGGREMGTVPISKAGRKGGEGEMGTVPISRTTRRVLEDIRILDFTHVVAGPVATRILADHGAEVIKVERTVTLDLGDRERGFFGNLNRGKQSIVLDMSKPEGVDLARRLAAASDVVIDNFSARVMGNWGLDYESLRRLRPDVIAVGMSGFGKTGPHRDYVSFGPTLQALTGSTSLMRHPGGEVAGWGFSYSDMVGGLNGAIAVLAALAHRRRTGEGQFVDLAQLESVAASLGPVLLEMANRGTIPAPVGNRWQEAPAAPHGVYRSAGDDRWVAIAISSDDEWRRFAAAVGERWTEDPRFGSVASRLEHSAELDRAVEGWTRGRSPEETTALLQSRGVAAFTVTNAEDLCARDPHLQWRGYWQRLRTTTGEVAAFDGVPARLSDTPGFVATPGPVHGADTGDVLRRVLGIVPGEIDRLRENKIIV